MSADPERAFRQRFCDRLAFTPDEFQHEAFDALDRGHSVLVSAPTGSGKTLVASYAVERAYRRGQRSFYTTPLKALSNQKHLELSQIYGSSEVGLLTGDIALNPRASIVVMTTEVLRNMLLAESPLLANLGVVVLDEVHYLQDPYRGGVWEEVLVMSPLGVTFVCLSATVANADDLGRWIGSVRGPTEVVVETTRPITLRHHFAVTRRGQIAPELLNLLVDDRPGEEGLRIDQQVRKALEHRHGGAYHAARRAGALPVSTPRRSELVDLLDEEELLPAIVFIFSRAACDDAVRQCLRAGVRLTSSYERRELREIAETFTAQLSEEDLKVLGYGEWVEGLEHGLAAHHAGMVPAFREAVEAALGAGLLGVVFATETLSLGINVPARTTVIERFTKYGGAGRKPLTSGEYAQLTGRAGRRGLDDEGHAVTLWNPETTFAEVARIAVAPPPELRSAFQPTYNLACNLVRRYDRARAHLVLEQSYAAWRAAQRPEAQRPVRPAEHLDRRLSVLGQLGYVDGWRLTPAGERLSRIYHECDLIVAEALEHEVLRGAEPSVLAGVLSALVFERRRAKAVRGHHGEGAKAKAPRRKPVKGDRLGGGRRDELEARTELLVTIGERVRLLEDTAGLSRSRLPEPGLATAIAAWVRGASFATVIEVAAADVGEVAPGDFVRAVKQLADLVGQLSMTVEDPSLAASASAAVEGLMRSVVVAGGPGVSATEDAVGL